MKSIISEYEDLRSKNEIIRRKNIEKVYSLYPDLKNIDKEIYYLGANSVKNIIKSPQNSDKLNKEYKKNIKELYKKRNEYLKENNIDEDFDKVKYECIDCKDTGFLENGEKCRCYKQKLIKIRYKNSNLGDTIENENFKNFSFDYYSKKAEKNKMSPYENMEMIIKRAHIFCDNFDNEEKGLLFYGPTGLGKTFVSSAIAKELMDKGKTVLYLRASRLFMMYEDYRFSKNDEVTDLKDVYDADLLIIDDLGTEAQNKNNFSFLFELISERINRGKKIIINTNYNMSELQALYTTRFTSRIYEYFLVYGFYGEDIRIQKLKG